MTQPNHARSHWFGPVLVCLASTVLAVTLVLVRPELLVAGEERTSENTSTYGLAHVDDDAAAEVVEAEREDRRPSRETLDGGFGPPPVRHVPPFQGFRPLPANRLPSEPTDNGFVFIDGEYVPTPYVFRIENGSGYVNDRRIATESRVGRLQGRWHRPSALLHLSANAIEKGAVMWIENGRVQILGRTADGYVLLKNVLGEGEGLSPDGYDVFPPELSERIENSSALPELRARARIQVERIEDLWAAEKSARSARSLLEQLHYPMTMLGLLVVATSVGHLFTSWPTLGNPAHDAAGDAGRSRIVWRSMAFVLVLSGLDLVWTILASRSGSMAELNPVAERFIADPMVLTYFKVIATGVGITLLLGLRRHHSAQTASLWLCLVCTLLTFRWLTFTSLFAS